MYYAEELIQKCTAEGVARTIAFLSKYPDQEIEKLTSRYQQIIDDIKKYELNDCRLVGEDFGFIAVPHNEFPDIPNVVLTTINKVEENNYSLTGIAHFSWYWGQTFSIPVHEKSIEKYGVDAILGGILYHITYYDMSETEIRPIRDELEKKTDFSVTNQIDFYRNLNHEICIYRNSLYKK